MLQILHTYTDSVKKNRQNVQIKETAQKDKTPICTCPCNTLFITLFVTYGRFLFDNFEKNSKNATSME